MGTLGPAGGGGDGAAGAGNGSGGGSAAAAVAQATAAAKIAIPVATVRATEGRSAATGKVTLRFMLQAASSGVDTISVSDRLGHAVVGDDIVGVLGRARQRGIRPQERLTDATVDLDVRVLD